MGQVVDSDEEGDLALAQLEEGARPDGPGQEGITDQGPPLHLRQLTLVLKQEGFCHEGGNQVGTTEQTDNRK